MWNVKFYLFYKLKITNCSQKPPSDWKKDPHAQSGKITVKHVFRDFNTRWALPSKLGMTMKFWEIIYFIIKN